MFTEADMEGRLLISDFSQHKKQQAKEKQQNGGPQDETGPAAP
jgi:hypothetical protein